MGSTIEAVHIGAVSAYKIKVPITAPSGRERNRENYLIRLDLATADGDMQAFGECQPRAGDTGDSSTKSWEFLRAVLPQLNGRILDFDDRDSDLSSTRAL